MPDKQSIESRLRKAKVTTDLPELRKVKAFYKQSFSSAARIPFRALLNTPEEGKAEFTAFFNKKNEVIALCYLYSKDEKFAYIPYIALEQAKKDQASWILAQVLDSRKDGCVVVDLVKSSADGKKKARAKKASLFLANGFVSTEIVERSFGLEYEFLVKGGSVSKEALDEYLENFWNSLEV